MKILISWMLLLLGVSLNSGHYIYQVEKEDAPTYEVKENPSGLVLVNTKLEKPTLRDILFYHLYDRDFKKEERPITERSFTNGHGYQFLEKLNDAYSDDKLNDEEKQDDYEGFEPKPLTDAAVKEAYKTRSYLFDQMRQRSDVISPDFFDRKKRQADWGLPQAPQLRSDNPEDDDYNSRRTYGMSLNPGGGYVWNNLNDPPSQFELGQSPNGYQNAGQSPQPTEPQQSEYSSSSAAPQNFDSGSSEDIYVNVNRPIAQPLENETDVKPDDENNPEAKKDENGSAENPPAPNIDDNSDSSNAKYPIEPILGEPEEDKQTEMTPVENPESPIESVSEPGPNSEESKPTESPIEPVAVNDVSENPPESTPPVPADEIVLIKKSTGEGSDENSEGDKVKEMPEAPTLPPLNYDNLPDYIRQAISSTESYDQTDNPFTNPQPSPEEKKEMEDKMEEIMATAQPVEDIPKTYGMNLTSGSGKVWNDLVSPPVSYEVGSKDSNQSEEPKETTTQAPVVIEEPKQPKSGDETKNPTEETTEPQQEGVTEPTTNPEQTVAPIEIPVITEKPENPIPNEPEIKLPGTEPDNEETTPNNELPYTTSTTEIPANVDSNEPDIKVPDNEQNKPNTDVPEVSSTTGYPEIIEQETKVPESGDNNEENKPNDNLEPVQPIEPIVAIVPVEPVSPVEDPEVKEPEAGSGETGEVEKPDDEKVNEPEEPKPEVDTNNKPEIMSELLKSEQFWNWLGEWTATYMELMEKHIRKIAIQEICNHSKQGIDMCLLDDKPEEVDSIIKDGKITIAGKEFDLSLVNNLDKLRRGNYNKVPSVDATTIYGNSVGNDKVTNVFIFNPNNAKDIIEGLKPENDTKVNIIIEDKNKEIEVPKVEVENKVIEETIDVKPNANTSESGDKIIPEDVKEAEVVVEPKEENKEVADVKEAKPDSSEFVITNDVDSPIRSVNLE